MNAPSHKIPQSAFTLIEVLAMTVLLSFLILGFYEGSQRLAVSAIAQQNRTEALLQTRRVGGLWRAGATVTGITQGNFLNGTYYRIATAQSAYGTLSSNLTRLAVTIGWTEPNPNAIRGIYKKLSDVYLRY